MIGRCRRHCEIGGSIFNVPDREAEVAGVGVFVDRLIGNAGDCRRVVDGIDDDIKGLGDLPAVGVFDCERDRCCAGEIGRRSDPHGAV